MQARDLPASDDNGSCDPYLVVSFAGQVQKTCVREMTTAPAWYTSLCFDVELGDLDLAPQLSIQVLVLAPVKLLCPAPRRRAGSPASCTNLCTASCCCCYPTHRALHAVAPPVRRSITTG